MNKISMTGLDIAKSSSSVHDFDAAGDKVLTKTLKRPQVVPCLAKIEARTVGLEVCASARHPGRQLGHEAKLILV